MHSASLRAVCATLTVATFLVSPILRAGTDYNSDGLCDVWQQVFNAFGIDPNEDEDLDGCSNLVESIAGTDPFNPSDCHHVGNLAFAGNTLVFTFMAEKGKKYRVVSADTPGAATWDLVEGSEKVSTEDHADDTISITKPTGDTKFYKLEVLDTDGDADGISDWAENKTGTDPEVGTSPSNASGGTATDGETLASVFSLNIEVNPSNEVSYEKENTTAAIHVTRTVGAMQLTLPYSVTGSSDETKGTAVPADYTLKRSTDNSAVTGGTIVIPAAVTDMDVIVDAVTDTAVEVPETVAFHLHRPGAGASVQPVMGEVRLADADPSIPENRTLYVAYLGREAGVTTTASGIATALVNGDNDVAEINLTFSNLGSPQNTAYLRVDSDLDILNVGLGQVTGKTWQIRAAQTKSSDQAMLAALISGQLYIDVTTEEFTGGEIHGHFNKATGSTVFTVDPLVHNAPAYPSASWAEPVGDEIERDIYRFLEQCTYGPTEALYTEVRALVDAAIAGGGTILDGYDDWLDQQMAEPSPSLQTLVMAADNEEFVLRGSKPINSGNDPNFGSASYGVTYDSFANPIISTTANSTYNNNHPFHNNRRREMWTLALQSKAQVRQRMTQALSEICVISDVDATVRSKHYGAASYWDMLADNAFGQYRTILENVTYHPMMGIYLSHLRNRAEYSSGGVTISPDENYAREIMQLFSIGLVMRHPDGSLVLDSAGLPIPTYDNTDITELAKVMTGFCHGARHNTRTVQRFSGLVFYNTSPRVNTTLQIQGANFTSFTEGGGDSWWQAPWYMPMKVLGRVNTITSSNRPYHDFGPKTLLHNYNGGTQIAGLTDSEVNALSNSNSHLAAEADLTVAHNLLAGNPAAGAYNGHSNTPTNISRWLIQRFTTSNPSAGYLYRVSEVYRNTNGNLGAVLKAILLDYEARSLALADSGIGNGRMKEPLVHFMAMLRSLNAFTGIPLTNLRDVPLPFAVGESPMTTPYPQSEVNKFIPNASRFRFGDYTSTLGQSPLAAPSVFNWFLPDYTVPGALSEAGLVSPEFQIATETNLVNRVNRLWAFTWANLVGMTTFPGAGVDTVTQVVTSGAPEVKVSKSNPGSGTSSTFLPVQTLSFTTSNWNVPQTITVGAVDDRIPEGDRPTTIAHFATSADANYNNLTLPAVEVLVHDNESAGDSQVVVTESGGETLVVEGGATDDYTLRLSSAPTNPVTVHIVPATTSFGTNTSDVTVSPSSVTFDSGNWNVDQTVTVTAVNDTTNEGPEIGIISHYVETTDANYSAANPKPVHAIVADNENNGSNAISILQTSNSTVVVEGGETDTYKVTLRRAPTGTVTVNINSGSQLTTLPTSLSFTTSNWNIPQTVTVTAVDDSAVEGNHSQQVQNQSSGGGYSINSNFTATVRDNDGGGIVIVETGGSTEVSETSSGTPSGSNPLIPAGNVDSYTVVLSSQPSAAVTVSVTPEVHPSRMSNWAKVAGYYSGDTNATNSDQQKDNVILDYDPIIAIYKDTFAEMPGISGSPSNAQKQDAHFAGCAAVVDKLDLYMAGGQLKAQGGPLTRADLADDTIVNPRKSIIQAMYSCYSTTRGNKSSDEPSYSNEVRNRCRIAAYMTSLSPASFISK